MTPVAGLVPVAAQEQAPSTAPPAPFPAGWLRSPRVQHRLSEVEARLSECVYTGEAWTTEVCSHLLRGGGKRLRPSLLLLASEFGDGATPAVLEAALGIELLHTATLYHDDVADEASCRRRHPSPNRLWGNRAAVFAGTYLFSRAIECVAAYGEEAGRLVSAALAEVWKGQAQETENVHNLEVDETTYFEIVKRKTAALCELPCRLGSLLARVDARAALALASYGEKLGIAFQVTDDVLDVIENEGQLGKPPGLDLQEGVYTLPVLDALRAVGPDARLRTLLRRRTMNREELEAALFLIRASGAIERATQVARGFAAQATSELRALPAGAARDSLRALAHEVANRTGTRGTRES